MNKIGLSASFLMVFYVTSIQTYQVNLSFDSLFPKTWYQKGLEASLHVWQSLAYVFEKNSDGVTLSLDKLLGRLAFAKFCITRMHKEGGHCIADDSAYFATVLHKVKRLLAMVTITSQTEDFIACAEDMITEIENKLSSTCSD
jgi:hypothetical protein